MDEDDIVIVTVCLSELRLGDWQSSEFMENLYKSDLRWLLVIGKFVYTF